MVSQLQRANHRLQQVSTARTKRGHVGPQRSVQPPINSAAFLDAEDVHPQCPVEEFLVGADDFIPAA